MANYKTLVRRHLQPLLDAGMTQRQVAQKLGIQSSMVLSERCPEALLPLMRLPALARLCGLTGIESLRLVKRLTTDSAKKAVQFDVLTFEWILSCTVLALKEPRNGI
jgi:hypothetical protein